MAALGICPCHAQVERPRTLTLIHKYEVVQPKVLYNTTDRDRIRNPISQLLAKRMEPWQWQLGFRLSRDLLSLISFHKGESPRARTKISESGDIIFHHHVGKLDAEVCQHAEPGGPR